MKKVFLTIMVALCATVVFGQTKKIEIKPAELPGCVTEWVKANMVNYTIDQAFKIDTKGVISYQVKIIYKTDTQWLSSGVDCKDIKKIPAPSPAPSPGTRKEPRPTPTPTTPPASETPPTPK